MEVGEGTPRSVIEKSPQELASQVESVCFTFLDLTGHPEGEALDERYKEQKEYVTKLLESGVSDEELAKELDRLYQEGRQLGIFSPLLGETADEFIQIKKDYYLAWGTNEASAEKEAKDYLTKRGYLGKLREWRKSYEKEIREHFEEFYNQRPLSEAEVKRRIAELKGKCIFIDGQEEAEELAENFSGGNYLYHGTGVKQAIQILESGNLASSKALWEEEKAKAEKEGREPKVFKRNSGYEGVSWNFNEVKAMPGDRYHLVGFLASPEDVLEGGLQLAVPSRPAPNELILIDEEVNADDYYSLKTQEELLLSIGLGETNSVWGNIASLSSFREVEENEKKSLFFSESMLQNFADSELLNEEMEKLLRNKYAVREDGTIRFSPDLLQQVKNELPVGAVWLQALIDTGRMENVPGFEEMNTVREVIEGIDRNNYRNFLGELRKDKAYLDVEYEAKEARLSPVKVPVSDTFLVISSADLGKWLRILARCDQEPKGVVVYDAKDVRLENFATSHRGDNQALSELLRSAIPKKEGFIDYEDEVLGEKITKEKMAGYRQHVVGEQYLTKRRSIKKDADGNIAIE
jgi:hypothetical protein